MEAIDFVITWVDPTDTEWQKEKAKYSSPEITAANSEVRYRDWENLKYWFRGVEKFAPWVNKIHFVTYGHIPHWLNTQHPKLNIVNHSDFIPKEYLPTFSSNPIELNLHRIKDLRENFVYFNDDIFITAPVSPDFFFKKGLPRDNVALDSIFFGKDSAGFFNGADITLINKNFDKRRSIRKNLKIWLSPKNGIKNIIRTFLLSPWPWFPGIYYQHGANSFNKKTFSTLWEMEYEALSETCTHKFRKTGDTNQWLMKFWQIAEGKVSVRSGRHIRCFHIKEGNFSCVCQSIEQGRYKILCINDTSVTTDFENKKKRVIEAFERLLPETSSFEKW